MHIHKAVFLDRDGTLIHHVPYLSNPDKVKLLSGVKEALTQLIQLEYKLFILSNQSGIGRGYYTEQEVHNCNERMLKLLQLPHPGFLEIKIAPEAPHQPSKYRKPSPAFILEKIAEYQLDTKYCYMVGDSVRDVETAIAAKINPIFVHNPTLPENEKLPTQLARTIPSFANIKEWVQQLHPTVIG